MRSYFLRQKICGALGSLERLVAGVVALVQTCSSAAELSPGASHHRQGG